MGGDSQRPSVDPRKVTDLIAMKENMLIDKITDGHVVQTYDTELKQFVAQRFVAGDSCIYVAPGREVDAKAMGEPEPYLPFDMVQPMAAKYVKRPGPGETITKLP